MRRGLELALVVALGLSAAACVEEPTGTVDDTCQCAEGRSVVDPALLAFLSKAKVAHHQADLAEDGDSPTRAIAALERVVEGPLPDGDPLPPEAREVLADTLARTAELRSGLGDFPAAKADLERGLPLVPNRTLFRGRLMEVRGVVEQRLQEKLLEDGDEAGAKAAKERAIAAFEEAVSIQDEVIQRTLADPP